MILQVSMNSLMWIPSKLFPIQSMLLNWSNISVLTGTI